jgi:hypothetical protein
MKVIAFSLWGNDAKYGIGAIKNVELARQIYPDWQVWIYTEQILKCRQWLIDQCFRLGEVQERLYFEDGSSVGSGSISPSIVVITMPRRS